LEITTSSNDSFKATFITACDNIPYLPNSSSRVGDDFLNIFNTRLLTFVLKSSN
jgi:hypothetical protein